MRILLVKPCCIGDVVMATALLAALRRAYPDAHITWGVGTHSAPAIADHPLLNALLPTGPAANPAHSPKGLWLLARQVRAGRFDLVAVPERSPLIGLAVWLAGVPVRAGLDSAGRGLFYTVRARIAPAEARNEGDIYLDVARALGLDVAGCWANIPARPERIQSLRASADVPNGVIVVHAGGGINPGMTMLEKRPPISLLAEVAARAAQATGGTVAILGGPQDEKRAVNIRQALPPGQREKALLLIGALDFPGLAALASLAALTIGPDTGVIHLMAAAGAPTVMIFGPSDPRRYAPFVPPGRAVAPWKPFPLPSGGVAAGPPPHWSWEDHGVTAEEVWEQAQTLLENRRGGP
jgi:ADP-heptose:LPS heptosyltransferase